VIIDLSTSSHLFRNVSLKDETMSLNILKFWPQDITVLGDINVEISPLEKPALVKFASLIIFLTVS
jgi:hypothetical protein